MDRLTALAPAIALVGVMVTALIAYTILYTTGRAPKLTAVKHNQVFGPFFAGYLVWMLGPIERFLMHRASPNTITIISLLLCAITGVAVSIGGIALAVFLYNVAGILDVLDGRIARLSGKQTVSGALLDSVCDRWGELFALIGYVWLLRDSVWLLAAMTAISGSLMVSYTRARAEGLGVQSSGGIMQRAERVVLVALGTLIAACFGSDPASSPVVAPILGVTLALCGVASIATAINRFILAYRALEAKAAAAAKPVVAVVEPATAVPALTPLTS